MAAEAGPTEPLRLRVALVGCGRISAYHVAALTALRDVEIVAVCDVDEKSAREAATRHGIRGCYTDAVAMFRETRPDAVHLLTPPGSHLALARLAAKYGAHMYIEQPFAATEAEARAILELAREAGVQVCPGHSRLFDPVFAEACRRIQAGEIGRVLSVRAEQGFTCDAGTRSASIPWRHSYDWGTFDHLICHPLYLACHFLTDPGLPRVVGLNLGTLRQAGLEELRVLIPSSAGLGEVSFSLCSAPEVNRIEVLGTKGRVTADWQAMTVLTYRKSGPSSALTRFTGNFLAALDLIRSGTGTLLGIATGKVKRHQGLRTIIERFYQSLRDGLPTPVAPEQGVLIVRLMDQIKEAGKPFRKQRPELSLQQSAIRPPPGAGLTW